MGSVRFRPCQQVVDLGRLHDARLLQAFELTNEALQVVKLSRQRAGEIVTAPITAISGPLCQEMAEGTTPLAFNPLARGQSEQRTDDPRRRDPDPVAERGDQREPNQQSEPEGERIAHDGASAYWAPPFKGP